MPQWTLDQRSAIDAVNHDILVSAAAGSGKTAVLVERMMRLAAQGMDVDRMLVVTFTRAAAAEMRERIQLRLSQGLDAGDAVMHNQLGRLAYCQMSTLHGFCQKVLSEHFQAVDLDPQARLCDPIQANRLFEQGVEQALVQCFEGEDQGFIAFSQCFEQADMAVMMQDLYRFLMSLENPWKWLEIHTGEISGELSDHLWTKTLLSDLKLQLQGMEPLLDEMERWLCHPDAKPAFAGLVFADREVAQHILHSAEEGMDDLHHALEGLAFMRAPAMRNLSEGEAKWVERMKGLRDGFKNIITSVKEQAALPLSQASDEIRAMAPCLQGLKLAVITLHHIYGDLKRDENVIDFYDLEHLTLAALGQKDVQAAVTSQYDQIFVDEYQDVSGIQEAIIGAIHGADNGLFMVGDVKQSIYRFRLADPTLFLEKQRRFSKDAQGESRKIILRQNFRSAPGVLQAVNQVFERIMVPAVTEIAYDEDAMLVPGRLMPDDYAPPQPELHIVKGDYAAQWDYAAQLITQQVGQSIWDNKIGSLRPCQFRDIVIMLPKAKGVSNDLSQALKSQGIPVYLEGGEEYFDLPEIHTMMEVLRAIDNPCQDLPLLAALRLPVFQMSQSELCDIRLEKQGVPFFKAFEAASSRQDDLGEKCRLVAQRFQNWRFLSRVWSLDKLCWHVLMETGVYMAAGSLPGGENRQANLRLLCQRAYTYDMSQSGGLNGFLNEGEELRQAQDQTTAKLLGENENLVRIMTIHKAKGLEFPVAYVMGLNAEMHLPNRGKIQCHKQLGIAIPYVNPHLRVTRPTLCQQAVSLRRRMEEKAERARLLYVAMTRAKEKLVLIGNVKKYPLDNWQLPAGAYGVYKANSMLDWVCQALWETESFPGLYAGPNDKSTESTGYPQSSNRWEIRVVEGILHNDVEKEKSFHNLKSTMETLQSQPVEEEVSQRFTSAAAKPKDALPLKTAVSAISESLFGGMMAVYDHDEEESLEEKAQPKQLVAPIKMSPMPQRPAFMDLQGEELTGAQRGTATHQALAAIDPRALRGLHGQALLSRLNGLLDSLMEQAILTKRQREAVQAPWLCRYFESDLGQRAMNAQTLRREWAFNYRLPGEGLTLVQGVIDCCFLENDQWVLIDYKTDYYGQADLLISRYTPQVRLYAQALAEITLKPVKEIWLFGLRRGEAIAIS